MTQSPPAAPPSPHSGDPAPWPGVDTALLRRVREVAATTPEERHPAPGDGASPGEVPGPPLLLRPGWRERLDGFVAAYHRLIQAIVAAYPDDPRLRRVLAWPSALTPDAAVAHAPVADRVQLLRLDTLPQADGTLKVLETNANCPAGLGLNGARAARWRPLLRARGVPVPPPLPAEGPHWAARWLLTAAERETGVRPATVALLCPEGANRTELAHYAAALGRSGVTVLEADPREVRADGGRVRVRGRPVSCAYAKIGMRDLARLRPEIEPYVRAVRSGALFVQNGLRGRLVGDNKLCLAVLSDPRFADLFPPGDHARMRHHIPWSRNIALCDAATVRAVRAQPQRYVLKHPLDTRGRGVIVGRAAADWSAAVDRAVHESWLVQEYCSPPVLVGDGGAAHRYDLALGSVDGRLVSLFSRLGDGDPDRLNVALGGRPHPVYA